MYVRIYVYLSVSMRVYIHVCAVYVYPCAYVCEYRYVSTHKHENARTCVRVRACLSTHTRACVINGIQSSEIQYNN